MRIAIYSRKSKFTGRGESIGNQVELCRRYAQDTLGAGEDSEYHIYEDEGYSAKNIDRPQFQNMLREARTAGFDCVICYRLDRISRNVSDFSAIAEEFSRRGIALVCIKEQFDTSTPMGRAMMYIASVFAQLERETIAQRVRDNMLLLARTGRWLGGTTPVGYISETEEDILLDGKVKTSHRLRIQPQEIEIVREIFSKYMELESIAGVEKYLLRRGIKTRGGNDYCAPALREILQNPVYCIADRQAYRYFTGKKAEVCFSEAECSSYLGLMAYNKRDSSRPNAPFQDVSAWIVALGKQEGIVPGGDWVQIQRRLEEQKKHREGAVKTCNHYALLSGMIFCTQCGSRMFAKVRGHSGAFDYICGKKLRGGAQVCACENLGGAGTDELVCDLVRKRMVQDKKITAAQLAALKGRIIIRGKKGEWCMKQKEEIDKREEKISALLEAVARPGVSDSLIRRIGEEVTYLEKEIDEFKQIKTVESRIQIRPETFADLNRLTDLLDLHEKREWIRLLLERLEWDGETLHLYLRGGEEEEFSLIASAHFRP